MTYEDNPPASAYPIRIDAWRTSDGKMHDSEAWAQSREADLRTYRLSTQLIHEGKSLAEVLEATGEMRYFERDRNVLSLITNNVGLVIRHYQCRDEPGYRVCRRTESGCLWVNGDAGSWSGYFGSEECLSEVIRLAKQTMDMFGGVLPSVWRRP